MFKHFLEQKTSFDILQLFDFQVGCDNVHFECDATDVNYILGEYLDRDVNGEVVEITNAKCCMLKKCPSFVTKETKENLDKSGLVCPN